MTTLVWPSEAISTTALDTLAGPGGPFELREEEVLGARMLVFANLLAHGLFRRFPNLRMASIETGSDWVFHLFEKLNKSYSQTPYAYPEDPRETFRRHVWVSPYYEDDLAGLREIVGADHMLMGSDYPHAEGLADPSTYIKDLENFGFTPEDSRLVMRDNGLELSQRRPA